jgi:fructose transport system substrate-binding protein
MRKSLAVLGLAAAVTSVAVLSIANAQNKEAYIGLITKTESNPFFVKMKEGAQKEATRLGAKFISAAGKQDGDNAGQVAAMENMVAAGVNTILLTASDSKAIVPAIKKAQAAGVQVIALDSPVEPEDATDALFATNNFKAGVLIGEYAAAVLKGKKPVIAALDLFPGHPVGITRHNGFLAGLGAENIDIDTPDIVNTADVVCAADSFGDQAKGQTAMENCLQKNPNINVVYTINEPAAAGAYTALKAAGKAKSVLIFSVDGGCEGVRNVDKGVIVATSQQYPLKMAALGVAAGVKYAKTGVRARGYVDTGVTLIAKKSVIGISSKNVKFGLDNCWGQ